MIATTNQNNRVHQTTEGKDRNGLRSDDGVRTYLTQMAAYPLLSREQEIMLAKQVEINRRMNRAPADGHGDCQSDTPVQRCVPLHLQAPGV